MSATEWSSVRCSAVRTDGQPCQAFAVRDGLCIGHQANARDAQAKGGAATSNAARVAKLLPAAFRPIMEELTAAFHEVHTGELAAGKGTAMAAIAGALVKVWGAGEQEERLREIEASIAEWQRADRGRWTG